MEKTCGTCAIGKAVVACFSAGNHCAKWIEDADDNDHWLHRKDDDAPEWCYTERTDSLEQVALDMYSCIAKHAYDWTQVVEETAEYYRDRLEALGVSV